MGGAASPRAAGTPRTAAAQAPELGGTDDSGVADPSWVTKLVASEAELGGTAEREAAVTRMQARRRGKLDRRHTADRVEQGEMAGQKRAKKAAEQELAAQLPNPNPLTLTLTPTLSLTPSSNPNPDFTAEQDLAAQRMQARARGGAGRKALEATRTLTRALALTLALTPTLPHP